MAATKRRRQTKHRGNAAGVIESRGRTGRKPTAEEKGGKATAGKGRSSADKIARQDREPTWKGAFYRSLLAAVVLLAVCLSLLKMPPGTALVFFFVVLAAYVPISFYTDTWIFRRRMRKKAQARRDDGRR